MMRRRVFANNSYFTAVKEHSDGELLVLPTDAVVFTDDGFRWARTPQSACDCSTRTSR